MALPTMVIAAFSAGGTYQLNSYGIGPGGTTNSSSSTYHLQGNAGEQTNGSTSGGTYTANGGAIGAEQINVPGSPTLSNGSGQYYNKLQVTIDTSNDPSDTTYSVAVSTNGFVTTNYVQADDTLGASAVYQTYIAWGSGSGFFMIGLTPNTTYQVKVDAKQGLFTNTRYSAAASAATAQPTVTFSISPNATTMPSLLPSTVVTSSNLALTFATNATSGGGVYVSSQHSGLMSSQSGYTIAAYTGNLGSATEGFGVQAANPSQTSGGPLVTVSPFNGTGNTVGAALANPLQLLSTAAPIIGGTADTYLKAKASTITPSSPDYQEILTFVASANF